MASEDHQQLLVFLKNTVEGLLISPVSNVWNIYGGLNRLHCAVERIFKHGFKRLTAAGEPDLWVFISGIRWLQPIPTTSPSNLIEETSDSLPAPSHISADKALMWIYKSLEKHSMSQQLSWLLSDCEHLASCYHRTAFLCQEKYSEAALICLRAVEQNQSCFLTEIDPSLYLPKWDVRSDDKCHRRCSSFPDNFHRAASTLQTVPDVTPEVGESAETSNCSTATQLSVLATPAVDQPGSEEPSSESVHISGESVRPSQQDVVRASLGKTVLDEASKEPANRVKTSTSLPCLNPKMARHLRRRSVTEGVAVTNLSQLTISAKRKQVASPPRTLSDSIISKNRRERLLPPSKPTEQSTTQRKSFIEDGGCSVQPMATGFFPRPLQGQSLTEFLSSGQFSRANGELDRENAHFSISEAIIAAFEQIKCNRLQRLREERADESDEEMKRLKQRLRLRRKQCQEERRKVIWGVTQPNDGKTDTATSTDQSASPLSSSPQTPSGSVSSEGVEDLELDDAQNLGNLNDSGLSISMASLYSEADISKLTPSRKETSVTESIASAEGVALSLIRQFSDKQLPRASDLKWLVSFEDARHVLLPLPKSWAVNPDDGERQSQLRGNLEWAPPRAQIIFTPHPPVARRTLMAKQKFRCAGCGMKVAPEYAHRFRYCEYLGRYFCTGCHSNQLSVIPGRIISKWDFTRCSVSTFSYQLIDQMATDPLFPIGYLNRGLYKKCRALERCRLLRQQLLFLKDLIFSCRYASELQEVLTSKLPPYMLSDVEMYSLLDLEQVKSGSLLTHLRRLILETSTHVTHCQFCLARGFFCELCRSEEVIFPWQFDSVVRCAECGSCYHARCCPPVPCPHCTRIRNKRASIEPVPYAEVATETIS